jgi:uncharacterized protein (TIRG00374 family)
MPMARSTPRVSWRTFFVAALTAGLLWLFLRNVGLEEMGRAFAEARLSLIAAAVAVTLLTYLIRARRWQALLAPIGPTRFRTAFRTTVIGFAVSFLIPRAGEVVRPYLLARRESLPASASFATIVVERLLDLVTVLLLFVAALPFVEVEIGPDVRMWGLVTAAVATAALAVLFVSAGHPERLGGWAGRCGRLLPGRLGEALAGVVATFVEGLAVMRQPARLVEALLWSVPLWVSLALGIWFTSLAFDLTFPFAATFIVVMFLVVGVSVPTPGAVGGFHYFYLLAVTSLFGANPDRGAAAGVALHAVSFVPVTLVGLVFMWQDGLTLGGLKGLRAEAKAAEHRGEDRSR